MKKRTHILSVLLPALVAHLAIAPNVWAIPFSETKVIIEVNATDGDAGIQIKWKPDNLGEQLQDDRVTYAKGIEHEVSGDDPKVRSQDSPRCRACRMRA